MLETGPDPTATQVLSVTELTRSIRALLEENIGHAWVEGEISNYRRQSSGHQYFTLKDDRSQLACVLFRNAGSTASSTPLADGLQVQAFGEVTVYESRGQHQLIVSQVQARGQGALQARFEALKRKLHAEGLFDSERKKPLPTFPATVGLVTSPTAAALQDMLNVLRRRAPWVRVLINPVRVQGQGASVEIARAVEEFNAWATEDDASKRVDLIVLARGGGSIEDLWEFNEEIVARTVAASALPVVSAVGHEIDFTIADFAADLRAPTPSAAAELIVPDTADLLRQLAGAGQFFNRQLLDRVTSAREALRNFARGTLGREPRRRVLEDRQRLDVVEDALRRAATAAIHEFRRRLDEKGCCLRVGDFQRSLALRTQLLQSWREKIETVADCHAANLRSRLSQAESLLRVLGPAATLSRGYSITVDEQGRRLRGVGDATPGLRIVTRLSDGEVRSTVTG